MNIPGFTAEASLYKTRGRYQLAVALSADTEKKAVVPQRGESAEEKCLASCYSYDWYSGMLELDMNCIEWCHRDLASYEGP
jgi:hypothetical protein